MARLNSVIPTSPLVDEQGAIRPEWRSFFTGLWMRTGGSVGQSTDTLEQELAAETAARQQGDAGLGSALQQEVLARQAGDNTEAASRANADAALSLALQRETQLRSSTDTTLVPKAQLCSLWAACDLSFLPTSDPGHGMPWLNDNVLCVGTSTATTAKITVEGGGGFYWTLESAGDWLWG